MHNKHTRSRLFFLLAGPILTACLLLPACDTVDETPGNERESLEERLVGTWYLRAHVNERFLTVSADQTILDPMSPGGGEIVLSGAASDTLRFLQLHPHWDSGDPDALVVDATNIPLDYGGPPHDGEGVFDLPPTLELRHGRGSSYARLRVGDYEFRADGSTGSIRFDDQSNALSLHDLALTNGREGTVIADGTLTAATRAVQANAPILFDSFVSDLPRSSYYRFDADGTFAARYQGSRASGTWRVEDEHVVLSGEDLGLGEVVTLQVNGDTLVHRTRQDLCEDYDRYYPHTSCFAAFELSNGIRAGTLSQTEDLTERWWIRSPAPE